MSPVAIAPAWRYPFADVLASRLSRFSVARSGVRKMHHSKYPSSANKLGDAFLRQVGEHANQPFRAKVRRACIGAFNDGIQTDRCKGFAPQGGGGGGGPVYTTGTCQSNTGPDGGAVYYPCSVLVGFFFGAGSGAGGGGGAVKRPFGGTFPCSQSPQAVIKYLENNFAAAADWQSGPLSVTFLQKGTLTQGSTIYIDGPIGYGLPSHLGGTSAVTVQSVGPTSFSFATVPGMHPFDNGTVTFSAAPASNGQVQFSVNVDAQFSGKLSQVSFNLGGKQLESAIWNHLTQSVQTFCQK